METKMWDLFFLGVPCIGAALLLIGSVIAGIRSRYIWYALPALPGLLSGFSLLGALAGDPSGSVMPWISAVAGLMIGLLAFSIVQRNQRK
jgi:hypothetical protein